MKLTKVQREILADAVASERKHGVRKPITCANHLRDRIDQCNKSFATYSKQMFKLLDAGIIVMTDLSYAAIVSIDAAEAALQA